MLRERVLRITNYEKGGIMSDKELPPVGEQVAEESTEKANAAAKAEPWNFSEIASSLRTVVSRALADRTNVVMVRVNDETLRYLDMLVEADICKSRSESAAFLIAEGVKANSALYERIAEVTEQIAELRRQLREIVGGEGKPVGEQAA
jgi:tRNA A37 threonylcarbamoyltransferase TsaD